MLEMADRAADALRREILEAASLEDRLNLADDL